jgi:hypothetical protein
VVSNNWLDELYNLRAEDKSQRQAETDLLDLQVLAAQRDQQAADILRQADAHNLLRQAQKALLDGKGVIDVFEHESEFDRILTLVWQGPISAARSPNPKDSAEYQYIAIGVRQGKLYVNDDEVTSITPETLQKALVKAAKNPGVIQSGKKLLKSAAKK